MIPNEVYDKACQFVDYFEKSRVPDDMDCMRHRVLVGNMYKYYCVPRFLYEAVNIYRSVGWYILSEDKREIFIRQFETTAKLVAEFMKDLENDIKTTD